MCMGNFEEIAQTTEILGALWKSRWRICEKETPRHLNQKNLGEWTEDEESDTAQLMWLIMF